MAHIQKRGPRRWVARYTDPAGRERAKSFARKVDAERFLTSVQHSMFSGAYVDPRAGRITFAEYAQRWRDLQPHRPTTARTIERHLRVHVLPALGERPIGSIRTSDVQAWATSLCTTNGLAPSTARAVFENVRAVFRSAVIDRLIVFSPCEGVSLPRVTPRRVEPLPHAQVRELVAAMHPRYQALVIVAAGTGLRAGELFGLQVRHVDLLRSVVRVEQQLHEIAGHIVAGPPKTPRSHRAVPLSAIVRASIAEHIRQYPPSGPDGYLFTAPAGGPIRRTNFMRSYWNPAARAAGIPVGTALHALRHYFASVLIGAGLSVKVVSELLGHTNAAQTLNTYAHLWPTDDERARRALDAVLDEHDTDTGRTDRAENE
jgi:integrase